MRFSRKLPKLLVNIISPISTLCILFLLFFRQDFWKFSSNRYRFLNLQGFFEFLELFAWHFSEVSIKDQTLIENCIIYVFIFRNKREQATNTDELRKAFPTVARYYQNNWLKKKNNSWKDFHKLTQKGHFPYEYLKDEKVRPKLTLAWTILNCF